MDKGDLSTLAQERGLQGKLLRHEPLWGHTSYRIGGPADFYVLVESQDQLCGWVRFARELKQAYIVIGGGTNLLIADKGFRGLVIENRCSGFTVDPQSHVVRTQTGASLAWLARETARDGLSGLEWATGIPGTVGGAVVNNAGAFDGAMADVVRQVTVLDKKGQIVNLSRDELDFDYRSSRFRSRDSDGEAILSTALALAPESTTILTERIARYRVQRQASQPRQPSAGSVFKNPPGLSAAQLIEQAGLKGRSVGSARVSPKHANYIVNIGTARASDVLELIELTIEQVRQRFQVELELEIELIGEWDKALSTSSMNGGGD